MNRGTSSLILFTLVLPYATGCSHYVENRVVQAFSESLKAENLDKLRKVSSDDFEDKALRGGDDTLKAFKQLEIPEGKLKVVKVSEDKDEKRVTVQIGKSDRKVLFRLEKDPTTKKWVVDELFLNRKELAETKSVGAQVNLLVGLYEFLEAWKAGAQAPILATSTEEFAKLLGELPPEQLARISRELMEETAQQEHIHPVAQIIDDTATVRLPKVTGDLVLTFNKVDNHWKADDIHVDSKHDSDKVPSVRQLAAAIASALKFYGAYAASDKEKLAGACTEKFFDVSLAAADLSLVSLPKIDGASASWEVRLDSGTASCIVQNQEDVLKLSLIRTNVDEPRAPPIFRVDEVTIYELQGNQDKRLSSLFTSHALMQIFGEALLNRDLETLRLSSTSDFNKHVWERLNTSSWPQLPLSRIGGGKPEVITTSFQGPLTQVTVNQGSGPLTYVLREQSGKIMMDDVLLPAIDFPESLKNTLDIVIPVVDFASGMRGGSIELIRANSTRNFCRLVWNQIDVMPELRDNPNRFLLAPLSKVEMTADRALVFLGNDHFGAKVIMEREHERFVVDDVILIDGPESSQRKPLRQILRMRLQEGK